MNADNPGMEHVVEHDHADKIRKRDLRGSEACMDLGHFTPPPSPSPPAPLAN